MQVGKIDASERLAFADLRIVERGGDELIEIDVLDIEGLEHMDAAGAQELCDPRLIGGAVEPGADRIGGGRHLAQRQRGSENLDEERFHWAFAEGGTGESSPSTKSSSYNGFLGSPVPEAGKYSRV